MIHTCKADRFLDDVIDHKMEIALDVPEKFIRHIQFRNPKSFNHWFDLVTWYNCLCINGDMGTYVFSRVGDMFTFFRSKNDEFKINPYYWHEKLRSDSCFEGSEKFSIATFEDIVKSEFRYACRENLIPIKKRKTVWDDISDTVLNAETEEQAHQKASTFESNGFTFDDFWEHNLRQYSYHFIWCLYAIVYGIQRYDKHHDQTPKNEDY